ncbi:MAG: substrate-binding protein [Ottowia sp.]|nr:substrate-binding protein [Ottowia sp.]
MNQSGDSTTDHQGPARSGKLSRRRLLQVGGGLTAVTLGSFGGLPLVYAADEHDPLGTWPAGSSGDTIHLSATVPLTGTYGLQGADELKGWELAVEHMNTNHELMKAIAPKIDNGVLGKKVALVSADSVAHPNDALQEQQNFITNEKTILMVGSTSSAVAVALNKFAQREKVLYMAGISGSNDTTGKDCVRYGFRQGFYGEMAANSIAPVLLNAFGKDRKMAFMTPDYTYGHTTTESTERHLKEDGGWTTVTNQVSPLGTQDFSQYLTNIANSGAEFLINVNWGRDAVLSSQQAKQFGLLPKMTLVLPYQIPFFAPEAGVDISEGVFAATDFWWTLAEDEKYPLAKLFVDSFHEKYGYRPEWGAENAYMSFAHWARMVTEAGSFYPVDVIKQFEKEETIPSVVGDVHYRAGDHQCVRPVFVVRGKAKADMRNDEDYWEIVERVEGDKALQAPDFFGCDLGPYT